MSSPCTLCNYIGRLSSTHAPRYRELFAFGVLLSRLHNSRDACRSSSELYTLRAIFAGGCQCVGRDGLASDSQALHLDAKQEDYYNGSAAPTPPAEHPA